MKAVFIFAEIVALSALVLGILFFLSAEPYPVIDYYTSIKTEPVVKYNGTVEYWTTTFTKTFPEIEGQTYTYTFTYSTRKPLAYTLTTTYYVVTASTRTEYVIPAMIEIGGIVLIIFGVFLMIYAILGWRVIKERTAQNW